MTSAEVVKGYEFEKGRWVVVGDEDIAKVRTESTKVINLVQFADESSIDPMPWTRRITSSPRTAWPPTPIR